ncbi:phosphatase PAP2 family protein [Streptomyces sp. NPDC002054]|uniref:phosphatase PAP2 family protein n=1 Tax=Streptomyces sp. NPDC002054 TaxID=3154663 RepID=UPI00331BA77E
MGFPGTRGGGLRWAGAGTVAAAGWCAAVAAAVLTLLVALEWRPLVRYDGRIAVAWHAQAVAHPGLVSASRVLTDWVWDPWTMRAVLLTACCWLWWRGERALAVRFLLAMVVAAVVQQGVKLLVARERPVWPDPVDSADYAAYPSGHALTATMVCGLLLWLVPRARADGGGAWVVWAAGAAAVLSVLGVGFTRIFLGVHWASDVLGGWLLGAAIAALALSGQAGTARTGARRSPASPSTDGPVR